jgi:hypothetical protein
LISIHYISLLAIAVVERLWLILASTRDNKV